MTNNNLHEFFGIESYVLLDWYVTHYNSKKRQVSFSGDKGAIISADMAVKEGSLLLKYIKTRLKPIEKMGFELRKEFVPSSMDDFVSTMYYLSFGFETSDLEKAKVVNFILERLKRLNLEPSNLKFKWYYLPSVPVGISTKGFNMTKVNGFTNIEKERVELNVFPPRDYSEIFKYLVHELIHVCYLKESTDKTAETVENIVEERLKQFFDTFSKDIQREQESLFGELKYYVENGLKRFSEANNYLIKVMKIDRVKRAVVTLMNFFEAIRNETVVAKPTASVKVGKSFS